MFGKKNCLPWSPPFKLIKSFRQQTNLNLQPGLRSRSLGYMVPEEFFSLGHIAPFPLYVDGLEKEREKNFQLF